MGIKYEVNEEFFDSWSPEMAYVLGFLFADGSLEDASYIRGKYVRVTSTDLDRVEAIKRMLDSEHTIVKERTSGNRKPRHLLRIGNHTLYDSLVRRGITPRKSLTMDFPNVPREFCGAFVRGYFDGDGCAYVAKKADGKQKRLVSIFTSGSKSFLVSLHTMLVSMTGIEGAGLYRHGSSQGIYQLRYSTSDSERIFRLMYIPSPGEGLYLARKYDIFTRYFEVHARNPRSRLKLHGLMAKK